MKGLKGIWGWVVMGLVMMGVGIESADIVVFGDSWGTVGKESFEKMAASHGLSVADFAIGGTTASFWAQDPDILAQTVFFKSPDAKYVWLTIGGNDFLGGMLGKVPLEEIISNVIKDTTTFLTPLFTAFPLIKVVHFGYDVLFWDYNTNCGLEALAVFWMCDNSTSIRNFTYCANQQFFSLQYDFVEALDKVFPDQHYSVNLLGSLQEAGGYSNASIGNPNPYLFSPKQYTSDDKGCIHCNNAGYDVIFANLW
eukprot:CAMPEP_0174262800 /NCGR_PEP_ID=MMETSP0439-20130205/15505_1 /TAXON_ID=0 /ORGANISM="Stereomyxa ramosa, Strain Chinc5" /LENGTH=252 /DNA_ID=CAMNT_0015347763 /DNA_START=36 /DNA_END=791 /DNA_ORIENTATION=-